MSASGTGRAGLLALALLLGACGGDEPPAPGAGAAGEAGIAGEAAAEPVSGAPALPAPEVLLRNAMQRRMDGKTREARQLAELAYSGAGGSGAIAGHAAAVRSSVATGLRERLFWLERIEIDEPAVRAQLATTRARIAEEEGALERAVELLREALAIFESAPESPITLSNRALLRLELARLSGDEELRERAGSELQRALALDPGNGQLLGEAAGELVRDALREATGARVDWSALELEPSVELLSFLYWSHAERDGLLADLARRPGLATAREMLAGATAQGSRALGVYGLAASLAYALRDGEALEDLLAHARRAGLDPSDAVRERAAFASGQRDAELRAPYGERLAAAEAGLEPAREAGGATLAIAVSARNTAALRLHSVGGELDVAALVEHAREGFAAAPSLASSAALVQALTARAADGLAASFEPFALEKERARRTLTPATTLVAWLEQGGEPPADWLGEADLNEAFELEAERRRRFPDQGSPSAWALARVLDPERAGEWGEAVREDRAYGCYLELQELAGAAFAEAALGWAWRARLLGDEERADAILRAAAKAGERFPFEL